VPRWRDGADAELERMAELAGEASAEAAVAAAADLEAALAVPPDLTAAAFFDVDNTMMMGASIFHFARGLASRKYFTTTDLASFAWRQLRFRLVGKENPDSVRASREQALGFVAGRSVQELVDLGEEIYDELMAAKIWSGTRALAQGIYLSEKLGREVTADEVLEASVSTAIAL